MNSINEREVVHHGISIEELVLLIESDLNRGLSQEEVLARREQYGENELPPNTGHGPLIRFLLQFHNPLIYVLLGAAAVTLAVGAWIDSVVIMGVVLVNAAVGFEQERRAHNALAALADFTRTQATVLRSGRVEQLDSRELVPGDVVMMEAGDKVPADVRLANCASLTIDESALTGESVPVDKATGRLPVDAGLGDRTNMVFSGTLVTSGNGVGLVVETGARTQIGKIHGLVGQAQGVATPLTKKLTVFSRWLTFVILTLAAATFALGIARGESAANMVTAAVALAVGAIPEGLPAAVTVTLAIGVSRMARRNAIIRKLPAAETLGSTTHICTDKTGTLTQNLMTVECIMVGETEFVAAQWADDAVRQCLIAGVLCNNSNVEILDDGTSNRVGDPTELALLDAAQVAGLRVDEIRSANPRVKEIPFDSETRFMATMHRPAGAPDSVIYIKGAVESVLRICGAGEEERLMWEQRAATLGDRALRVLAFAYVQASSWDVLTEDQVGTGPVTFVGLQAMADPPREEAIHAIDACHKAGIRVIMITGDHGPTARAIAEQVHLSPPGQLPRVVMGVDLVGLSPTELLEVVQEAEVLARVSAEQKLRVVEALQGVGYVVAMTGDGINDAPALKQADIGIAMGLGGTEVAKESSDMILTDDDFATIEAAIEEGRGVFDNLTKFIAWTLPTNVGEGLVILVAIVAGTTLPILPVQILWINMTTAVLLGLMLAFEPREPDIMTRPPRSPSQPILTGGLASRVIFVGVLMLIGAFGAFEWALAQGGTTELARTVAVNAFVAMEIGYLFACRSLRLPLWGLGWRSNPQLLMGVGLMVLLQLGLTYLPWLQAVFATAALPVGLWVPIVALGVIVFSLAEATKWVAGWQISGDRLPWMHAVK